MYAYARAIMNIVFERAFCHTW